jgi:hypothetical protein
MVCISIIHCYDLQIHHADSAVDAMAYFGNLMMMMMMLIQHDAIGMVSTMPSTHTTC